ncbi:hypothetical protein TcG_03513 [Trypanosoma cruzi]|nr:hypothetical protein TcBrA4_0095490 [Trypanosoma cruzi]PBJ74692.1 hypothetical protein BCY84_12004 [Trypanosoma cruzi cruzi]RNF20732.1 hypothetical protein TcG_03513 [Trypanosoma cruzi]
MQRRLLACTFLSAATFLVRMQNRWYYEKVRQERDGSDNGPAALFHEFPRSPSPNRVPEEFHTLNTEAVNAAEGLQRWFLLATVGIISVICFSGFLDPFREGYRRPEGYGMYGGKNHGTE